jgi:hypothetical protein
VRRWRGFLNRIIPIISSLLLLFATSAWPQTWEPVTGADELSALFSDTVMTATLKDNVTAIATYNSDGSGEG